MIENTKKLIWSEQKNKKIQFFLKYFLNTKINKSIKKKNKEIKELIIDKQVYIDLSKKTSLSF
jgi:hypothetical protein